MRNTSMVTSASPVHRRRWLAAAITMIASVLWTPANVTAAPMSAATPSGLAVDGGALAAPPGSVFVAVSPCRAVDTRNAGGPLGSGITRSFQIAGFGGGFAAQGGTIGGCGVPTTATAVSASVSAVDPAGTGFFRMWPSGGAPATATFLNFTKSQGITNTGAIGLGAGPKDLTTKNFGAAVHYVIDVQGYYVDPSDVPTGKTGSVFVAVAPCRVVDTRTGGGPLASGATRSFRIAGAGAGFAGQGGTTGGCDVPATATAVSASVSAVDPTGNGFLRVWPSGGAAATATFLNFTKNQGITNTGAIGISPGPQNLTTKNFGAVAHYVIDVQGYFAAPADVPTGKTGSTFVAVAPCRVVDTRNAGGSLTAGATRSFQIAGSGTGFASQGGAAGGCDVPAVATAVSASVTAVAPTGNGFFRAWPSGGPAAMATFLNFTKNQGITNTGDLGLGTGSNDLTTKNFGAAAHYVIDVGGYYIAPTTVAAGTDHTCAALAGGTVECWGENGLGQLGNGTTADATVPVAVSGITAANAIAVGADHSCAVLDGGSVECWGGNAIGQLGDGSTADSSLPVAVTGISTATAITVGTSYTCALLSAGSVECWGRNDRGQLGDGTRTASPLPVVVSGITTAVAIDAGYTHACALLAGGNITCWGQNDDGQLGNGNNSNMALPVPVAVVGITSATAVSAAASHSCALLAEGSLECWGYNAVGSLGNGTTVNSFSPVPVSTIGSATAVTGSGFHSCALLAGGSIGCWGANYFGELGNGTMTGAITPGPVSGITSATVVSAGFEHTCAVLADDSIKCWGRNDDGQLGNGTLTDSMTPVAVSSTP